MSTGIATWVRSGWSGQLSIADPCDQQGRYAACEHERGHLFHGVARVDAPQSREISVQRRADRLWLAVAAGTCRRAGRCAGRRFDLARDRSRGRGVGDFGDGARGEPLRPRGGLRIRAARRGCHRTGSLGRPVRAGDGCGRGDGEVWPQARAAHDDLPHHRLHRAQRLLHDGRLELVGGGAVLLDHSLPWRVQPLDCRLYRPTAARSLAGMRLPGDRSSECRVRVRGAVRPLSRPHVADRRRTPR